RILDPDQLDSVAEGSFTPSAQLPLARQGRRSRSSRLRRRWWWVAALLLVGLGVGLAVRLLVRPAPAHEDRPARRTAVVAQADHLAGYAPSDCAAVLSVKPAALWRASIFTEPKHPEQLLRTGNPLAGLFESLGIDLVRDVDWIRGHVAAEEAE